MALVDVILPTYNDAFFLKRAIDNILAQKFNDFSFIIVNDGSDDDTANILSDYATRDKRIMVLTNNHNNGLPYSLNRGHLDGKSAYCTWVSTDNISYENHLGSLYNRMVSDNFDMVQGNYVIKENGGTKYIRVEGRNDNWGCGILGAAFLYKRKVWETYHYDESLQCVEDLKFYLQVFLHPFKIGYVDEYLVEYYQHPNSLTAKVHKNLDEHYKKISRVFEEVVRPHIGD